MKGRYADTSRENFSRTMLISCFSFTELAKRAAELMPETGGSMITLTFGGSTRVMPNYNVMGVAKAALEASVRYLASDFGSRGIRVNAISAGPVRTLAGSGIGEARAMFAFQQKHSPLGRGVTLDELGGSALYLLSDLSGGVTGEIHYVDSGYNVISMPRPEDLKAATATSRRDLLGALERRPRHAAGDIGVERRPRRHHLEQPHRKIQRRADRDVGGGKILAENPRALGERLSSTSNTRCASPQPAATEFISILVAICTIAGSMQPGAKNSQ